MTDNKHKPTVTELLLPEMDDMPYRHVEGEDFHDELAYYVYMLCSHFTVMSNLNKARFGMVVAQLAREYLGDTFYRYTKTEANSAAPQDAVE